MKVSTSYLFDRATERMTDIQNRLATTQAQLSVSKQILSPSDAPDQAAAIQRIKGEIDRQASHSALLKAALNRYRAEETSLTSANDILTRLKELGLHAANDTLKCVGTRAGVLHRSLHSGRYASLGLIAVVDDISVDVF